MLDRDDARERIHPEQGDEPRRLRARVWRVREGHVVLPAVQLLRELEGVHPMDHRPVIHLRSEEHTSELQSLTNLVCRLLLEKKKLQSRPSPVASSEVTFADITH